MLFLRVDPETVTHPDFFGLADCSLGVGIKKGRLDGQFIRQPVIVRIEKSDQGTMGCANAGIAGRANAAVFLLDTGNLFRISRNQIGRVVR